MSSDVNIMQRMAKTGQDPNLDILRSVAILAVFAAHALQVSADRKFGEHFAYGVETFALGRIGVLLFFVHTSLVLMQSLERTGVNLSGGSLIGHFYIRRAFRIYPLSVCLVVVSIIFSIPPNALNVSYQWQGMRWVLSNILFIQNITGVDSVSSPMWSLPFEVQMYLLLPLLFLVVKAPRGRAHLPLIYIVGLVLSLIHPLFRYFPCFLAGIIAYKLLETESPRFPAWLWGPVVISAAVLYVLAPFSDTSWAKDVLTCMAVALLIPLFQRRSGPIATAASHLARHSYGVYLCHMPIMWLLYRKLAIPAWQRGIWLVIATGFVSVACYFAIEEPLIRTGTRLANRMFVKQRVSAAAA